MSLAPLVDVEVRGVEGKDPEVATICSVPGCISRSQEGHHIWSRSFLRGQPTGWVKLPSGAVLGNKTGLCIRHHKWVTGGVGGHQAWIRLEPGDVLVWYENVEKQWHPMGPLTPQPPIDHAEDKRHPLGGEAAHVHLSEGQTCESCGYTKPTKRASLPKRPTSAWTILVPDDAEVGADVLDDWTEQFAVILGLEVEGKRLSRYHVAAVVFAWAIQNKQQFIRDIVEASHA